MYLVATARHEQNSLTVLAAKSAAQTSQGGKWQDDGAACL